MDHPRTLDLVIVAIYMAGLLGLGFYFSRRQTDTDRYFAARRSIPAWALGMSMFATIITSISFIAYPGSAYGGNWTELIAGLMALAALAIAGKVVVPFFRHAVGLSAYEYFERRFGYGIRVYASLIFSLGHLLKMGFILYLLALTVGSLTGWSVTVVIAAAALITVLYTLVGGLEAVIWADVIQGFILWAGLIAILIVLLVLPPGGAPAAFAAAAAAHKISFGSWHFDFTQKGVLVMACYGIFFYLQKYTADQTIVQRYLAADSDRSAVRGVAIGAGLCVPVWALFLLIGTLTWAYYHLTGEVLPARITKVDQIFPFFLSTHMPAGLSGLILASLFASAMSGISSDLNCLAVVGVEDYYRKLRPHASDQRRLLVGRLMVVVTGVVCAAVAVVLARHAHAALPLYFTTTSIIAGGLFGVFFLAFLCPRANTRGIWIGVAVCLLFSVYATLTSGPHRAWDTGIWNFAWQSVMIGTVGHVLVIVFGYAASRLFPSRVKSAGVLTYWEWRKQCLAKGSEDAPATTVAPAPQS